ncbi:putative ubiquitin-interacting motif containing protein [Lyophyllum shimeji]|uniref:Ubiquitin-interacting motif containing protein n=1 Tax=Lyophyllum shimeji TaxID=47721 RepID=A0A9P3UTV3_LYOSH|nr:putative ubiquitin-interacting motif containing protein [Lyophyllum shimeji]
MLNSHTHTSSKESPYLKPIKFNPNQANQHGVPDSRILLDIPSETLTGITSYLDPPSMLALARVHGRLNAHIKNDNTWHRAFVCQFLNIGPESDIDDDVKSLMLRRSENSWRNEFITRYRLRRRWQRSRNTTVAHAPVHTEISSMHMMPGPALLVSSTHYGIVSRSLPLTGKIFPGYLDASGLHLGLGVGNPNAEFSPDVSVCTLASDGGTAKVLWGFRHGEVGVMTAPRVLDASKRPVTDMVRCDVNDEHVGAVLDAVWGDAPGAFVVTAGADATVKIWDAKTVRCLWTAERKAGDLVPDPCLKVAVSVAKGMVVTVTRSGEVAAWTGFQLQSAASFSAASIKEVRIACPIIPMKTTSDATMGTPRVSALHIDPHSPVPTILVAYEADRHFYGIRVTDTDNIETTAFGDASFAPISALAPFFSAESSFVFAGDTLGCVSLYNWSTPPRALGHSVHCVRKFEAHEDGASVTALAWNGLTLVTGSARGTSHVWDGLTFEHLRSFPSPVPRIRAQGPAAAHGTREREPVRQILLGPEKEVLLVSVGDRVLAWKAGPVPKTSAGGVRGRHTFGAVGKKKKDRRDVAKYLQQVELNQTIAESTSMLRQESDYMQEANVRAKAQHDHLERLGLSETEALEYVLMLSRDEALQRESAVLADQSGAVDEGVFEGDFDFDDPSFTSDATASSSSTSLTLSRTSPTHSGFNTPRTGQPISRAASSTSNEKIQISPRLEPEPMEAGFETPASSPPQSPQSTDEAHFPAIRTASTPPVAGSSRSFARSASGNGSGSASSSRAGGSVRGSPQSVKSASAWSVPLQIPAATRSTPSSVSASSSARSSSSYSFALQGEDAMDEELKFALELSLAEARSRGEAV